MALPIVAVAVISMSPCAFGEASIAGKQFDAAWVKSLKQRGEPQWLSGAQLRWIGMPVGGIGAGQLYLGGDGKLWDWEIFNLQRGPNPGDFLNYDIDSPNNHYTHPMRPESPLDQGFALRVKGRTFALDRTGFESVQFLGEYPIGRVRYRDRTCPVEVELEAFSPFIPGDVGASSLPATLMNFTLRNTSGGPIEVEIGGWLQNAVGLCSVKSEIAKRQNECGESQHCFFVESSLLPTGAEQTVQSAADVGTMAIALLNPVPGDRAVAAVSTQKPDRTTWPALRDAVATPIETLFDSKSADQETRPISEPLTGAVIRKLRLEGGESASVSFAVTWWMPNLNLGVDARGKLTGRAYAARFDSARAVAEHVAAEATRYTALTRKWRDTWYDSTLPRWFLDRTFANLSTLATDTCFLLGDGRFTSYEGVGSCEGTCSHVWQYAQGPAYIFPEIERRFEAEVAFGSAQDAEGWIGCRSNPGQFIAVDGQAGYILRAYRERRMTTDDLWFRAIWPKVKLAMQAMIKADGNKDGIIEGSQLNTLDASWYGPSSWISGLYVSALAASAEMAMGMGDGNFTAECNRIAAEGRKNLVATLYNGEYFYSRPDPKHPDRPNSGGGCLIDQVLGQQWAMLNGLPRTFPEKETHSALNALWQYNYLQDVGPLRAKFPFPLGRYFATPGEAGMIICSFPRPNWDFKKASGTDTNTQHHATIVGYFNECMSGFEYTTAAAMMGEGMVEQALAVTRTVHDRYDPLRRNPYNEVECGDHYVRAMAAYNVFLAACGYEPDAPESSIGFAPKFGPEDFRAAFTAAGAWGSYSQKYKGPELISHIEVKHGKLRLKEIRLAPPPGRSPKQATVTIGNQLVRANLKINDRRAIIILDDPQEVTEGHGMSVSLR